MEVKKLVENRFEEIKKLREELHCNPEIAFNEFKTQEIIKRVLNQLEINNTTCAKTGVVGVLNKGEQCIAVRSDMDALPVNGMSHACGHDFHMAVVLGTAMVLKDMGFDKCVKFIFQPAEENVGGALPMIKEAVLENPKVKYIIGCHVWPGVEVGKVAVAEGPSMAAVDHFSIKFIGVGGHGATPHLCRNPLYPAIDLIQNMNNKSRMEYNALNSHIISFASLNSGNIFNVIPEVAEIKGTVRTFDEGLRKKIYADMIKTAKLTGEIYGCTIEADYRLDYPALFNDGMLVNEFIKSSRDILGHKNVLSLEKSFAAEDFAYFAERVPAVHFRLGISDGIKGTHPLHSPDFDASEEAIYYGVCAMVNFVLSIGNRI